MSTPPVTLLVTDYRLISQDYAQGAIRAVLLINGAAAAALLSQVTTLKELVSLHALGFALFIYVSGVAFGALTWLTAFESARQADIAEREAKFAEGVNYRIANSYHFVSEGLLFFGIIFFLAGSCFLILEFL